jgi:taurine dioxygenase
MIVFTPLTGAIGADVHGIDLTQPLDGEAVAQIRHGLLEYLVLFFREQQLLTIDQHMDLARHFGELEETPFRRSELNQFLLTIDMHNPKGNESANFHADNTFRDYPPVGALLQARELPSRGGDTCFASMYAAYEALSPHMQAFLNGLEAYHSLSQMVARLADVPGLNLALDLNAWPPMKHPVIAVHPETGRKLLNVNFNWTTHIDGLPRDESTMILKFLFEHIKRPEFQVRMHWNVGDVTFWDNRATQHYAVPDYSERRLMQRVSLLQSPAVRQESSRAN